MGGAASFVSQSMGNIDVETPKYEVIRELTGKDGRRAEIRRYEPGVAIEVSYTPGLSTSGDQKEVGNNAFRILAAYIGVLSKPQNRSRSSPAAEPVAMTAPVVTTNDPQEGEPVAMTAPVLMRNQDERKGNEDIASEKKSGTSTMQFILPSKYTIDTAPIPTDDRVKLVEIPARVLAANTFSGYWKLENVHPKRDELFSLLDENSVKYEGDRWSYGGYNPPWTPGFWRKNEVFVPVQLDDDTAKL